MNEMNLHDLRHTYASLPIGAKVQPMVVAERLGHTDARLVLQRYGHLYPGAAAQAAMALDLYLKAWTCTSRLRALGRRSTAMVPTRTSGRKRRWILIERTNSPLEAIDTDLFECINVLAVGKGRCAVLGGPKPKLDRSSVRRERAGCR